MRAADAGGALMSPSARPTQFGRIHQPDEAWLATRPPEPILEPDLPIVDTHHHLWERGGRTDTHRLACLCRFHPRERR